MDSISALALSVDDPTIRAAGFFLDNAVAYGAVVLALLLIGERRDDKRMKIFASLLVTVAAVWAVKYAMAYERPCAGEEWCPGDYSFPSMHAATAFALMTGFLNKRSYPLFLLFALFVSFTRLNIGVHLFGDVAGALPIALISYYLTDIYWRESHGA
ncbi:MAG: phosphatase PAP2 family protein [Candidatus Micrarchaeota archaeon]